MEELPQGKPSDGSGLGRHSHGRLLDGLQNPASLVPVDRVLVDTLGQVNRDEVPDMPDRITVATALALGVPLLSRDRKIRASLLETI